MFQMTFFHTKSTIKITLSIKRHITGKINNKSIRDERIFLIKFIFLTIMNFREANANFLTIISSQNTLRFQNRETKKREAT